MSDTRSALITATMELMLRQGYAATGVNDICLAVGVSKGAFYHAFPSKEALTVAALEAFYRRGVTALASIDVRAAAPEDRLPSFVEGVARLAPFLWEHGCLMGGLASEVALVSDPLQREVARLLDEMAAQIADVAGPYVEALADDELTARAVAQDFLAIAEGAIVLSRAHRDPERIRVVLERYAHTLRLLLAARPTPSARAPRS